jgi:HK97 gp10 family phage protein
MTIDEAKADLNRQISEMQKKITEKSKRVHSTVYEGIVKACAIVERTAKEKMHNAIVDSSKTYGKRGHHPSVPGSAPAPDTGTMLQSVTHSVEEEGEKVIGYVGSVLKDPPYPSYLEDGTSKMAPRPWLQVSIDENREKIQSLIGGKSND